MRTQHVFSFPKRLPTTVITGILCLFVAGFADADAPSLKEYSRDFDSVWTATIEVLQVRGDPIVHSDKGNGIITTDYKAEEGAWRHKFSLLLTRKGELGTTVSVTCALEKMSKSAFAGKYGKWEDKKSDGTRESQLLEAIAQRLQSGTPSASIPQRDFQRDFEAVWVAAISVLQQHGDPIINSDKANGIITTDYKADEDVWRHKFSLLLVRKGDNGTNVSVTCIVEKMSKSVFVGKYGKWEDQKSDGKHENQLLSDILDRLQL